MGLFSSRLVPWIRSFRHDTRSSLSPALLLLGTLFLCFSLVTPGFFSLFNLAQLLESALLLLLLAVAQTWVISAGFVDLSGGALLGVSSVLLALTTHHLPIAGPFLLGGGGVLVGVFGGLLIGLLHGMLFARLPVPSLLVTFGSASMLEGIGFLITAGVPAVLASGIWGGVPILVFSIQDGLRLFPSPDALNEAWVSLLSWPLLVSVFLIVCSIYLMYATVFGQHVLAMGNNTDAARGAGIPTGQITILVWMIAGSLAALAGIMYALRYGSGRADAGGLMVLDAVAAVILGGTAFSGGHGRIGGTVAGVLALATLQNGLILLGVDPFWRSITSGILLILAISVQTMDRRAAL